MSMNTQMQEAFTMFYGMCKSLKEEAKPVEMPDDERVSKAKAVFLRKIDTDMAIQLETCTHCGICSEACHFFITTGDPKYTPARKLNVMKRVYKRELSPFRLINRLFYKDITVSDLEELQELVFDSCTICGRCSLICPVGISIGSMVGTNRVALAAAGMIPDELLAMQQEQLEKGTIFGADIDLLKFRINQLKEELDIEIPLDNHDAEIMVLTSGLDIHLFTDALAGTAEILNHLGVPWTICSDCFEAANFGLLAGHEETLHTVAMKVINKAIDCKVKYVLTPECGHAFPALRWEGSEIYGKPLPFHVMSVSEYVGCQVVSGKLKLEKTKEKMVVSLHDPCKVGRWGGSFDDSRAIVNAIGLELRETESSRQYNFCCGGGAGVFLLDSASDLRQKAYRNKMNEIKAIEAEAVIVSCGSCRMNFETGKARSRDEIPVHSLVALAAEHLPGKGDKAVKHSESGECFGVEQEDIVKNKKIVAKPDNAVPDNAVPDKAVPKSTASSSGQFSLQWMEKFQQAWNKNPEITEPLEEIKFNSNIGYGLLDDKLPLGILEVNNGKVSFGGVYDKQRLNWDIRADQETWDKWKESPPGMMAIGIAYTSRKLQFIEGDYASMIKEPRMAGPFIKSFKTMAEI